MTRTLAILVALAAACGAPTPFDDDPPPGGKADDGTHHVAWSVSRHVWPTDAKADITRDLALIAELGARFVRTDLWWYAVQPSPTSFDRDALAFYRWYVEEAQHHGLGVIVVLSNPPEWARSLDGEALARAFMAYAREVAAAVGDLVGHYQLWNEPNHVVDAPDHDTDLLLFRAGRTGLDQGRALANTTRPMRTIINVLVDGHDAPLGPRWEDDLRYYFDRGAGQAVDVIAIDHYPGTWSVGDWGGNILDRLFSLGAHYGTSVAIFEAGYATARCAMPLNTEDAQARWIREQLPRMRAKLANTAAPFELVNWFKLDDRNTGNCFDPEDNFGVVRTDRSRKPAFAALADEIEKF